MLGKINASLNTLGMYIYSAVMGVDMSKFTKFMTSPIIDEIINLSNSSLTNTSTLNYDIDQAIRDVQNEFRNGTMYSNYIKDEYTESIVNSLIKSLHLDKNTLKTIKDELQIGDKKLRLSSFFESNILKTIVNDAINTNKDISISGLKSSKKPDLDEDEEYEPDDESMDYSKIDKNKFFRWFVDSNLLYDKLKSINIDKETKNKTIDLFQRIRKEAGSLKVLGQMLGINQGLKRSDYEFYKYNNILSDYINDRLNKEGIKKEDNKKIYYYINDLGLLNTTSNESEYNKEARGFNFGKFLNDKEYQSNVIKSYGSFTNNTELNILEYLSSSDHFMEMIKTSFDLKDRIYPNISVKFRSLSKAISDLENNKTYDSNGIYVKGIKEEVFNGLSNYFDDKLINDFFDVSNLKINAANKDIYTTINSGKDELISKIARNKTFNLSTLEGRTEFTSWFENIVISNLKNGKSKLEDGTEYEADYLKENKFLLSTDADSKKDVLTKEKYFFLKPKIEYSSNISSTDMALLQDIVEDFRKLKNLTYAGNNIHDLFFLYNLIVNRNKSTRQSFTYILSNGIDNNSSALHNQYLNFIKELDKSTNYVLELDKEDVANRGIAPKSKKRKKDGFYKMTISENGKIKTLFFNGNTQIKIPKSNFNKNIILNTNNKASDVKIINENNAFKDLYNLLNSSNIKMTIKC